MRLLDQVEMYLSFCASALTLSSRTALRIALRRNCIDVKPMPSGASSFYGHMLLCGYSSYTEQYRSASITNRGKGTRAVATSIEPPVPSPPSPDSVDSLRARFRDFSLSSSSDVRWCEQLIRDEFPFPLDSFQLDALTALAKGESVVLSAPTGAGKTIVGEMAVYLALCKRLRVFYTTPLKALSNQKFYDFKKQFGVHRVGLLTGDVTVNRDADIIVMTTEVYRNMLYADSTEAAGGAAVTDDLFAVIFDEFHYLNDRARGTVWEESVINSPNHVLLVALSATMSNTLDVRDWFCSVQGPTRLVESSTRPVPLNFAYCDREGMTPLFAKEKASGGNGKRRGFRRSRRSEANSSETELKLHPELLRRLRKSRDERERTKQSRQGSRSLNEREDPSSRMKEKFRTISAEAKGRRRDRYTEIPSFQFVVRTLSRRDMLPCIIFIFSRAGCDRAAMAAATERGQLVSDYEKERIQKKIDMFVAENPGMVKADRIDLALQGIASHHAGLLPLWKLCVEELFQDGLIKVVFATETLAAGINMPARTTVISALSKRAGEEGIVSLTTSEVLQMAGRAGRRGKDIVGHSMLLRSRNEGALDAFKVLTTDVDALQSQFSPSYGMVLNLLSARSLADAKALVDRSFGNFLRQKQFKEQMETTDGNASSIADVETRMREKAALESVLQEARGILDAVDRNELRSYVKNIERVKAEKRALAYLVQQSTEMDAELIEETLSFAPVGTRLLLKEGTRKPSAGATRRRKRREYSDALTAAGEGDLGEELKSFYLGASDTELGEINAVEGDGVDVLEAVLLDMHNESVGVMPMFAALDASGALRIFNHYAVARLFYDEDVVDVEGMVENWGEVVLPPRSDWMSMGGEQFVAPLPEELCDVAEVVKKWKDERTVQEGAMAVTASERAKEHPEVFAQQQRVEHAKDLVRQHELHSNAMISTILAAKRAVPMLEATLSGSMNPFAAKKKKGKGSLRYAALDVGKQGDSPTSSVSLQNTTWDDFMSLASVLQQYGFLDEQYNVTSLGGIGAKVRSENEVWTSILLMQPSLEKVSPVHLGAILGATQIEGSRSDVYMEYELSEETKKEVALANTERVRLCGVQAQYGVSIPVAMDADMMGLVEKWASGVSWVELLSGTSLQEGDACRILRRVLDLLRQVQYLPVVSEDLKRNAKRAVALLDRFPVTDDRTYIVREHERSDDETN